MREYGEYLWWNKNDKKRDSVILLSVSRTLKNKCVCACIWNVSHVLQHNQFQQSYRHMTIVRVCAWTEIFAQCTQSSHYMVDVCSSPFLFFSRHCWSYRRHIETVDQRASSQSFNLFATNIRIEMIIATRIRFKTDSLKL